MLRNNNNTKPKKTVNGLHPVRFWIIVTVMGLAGHLCWNIENQWFNTFVYAKIGGDVSIVTWMVIVSATVTTLSTFIFGTLSDRMGKRKRFVSIGYILWGVATILFGLTEFARSSGIGFLISLTGFLVVFTDAVMSFLGSLAFDAGYTTWVNDYTDETNQGQIGGAFAALPVLGTIIGTVIGGILVNIGNPTVGTESYNPSLDNYQLLFWGMGIFVILIGIASIFLMKDAPDIKPHKEGSYFKQFAQVFNFRKLKGHKENKEMFLACLVACFFFIPFNFYFVHMGNWLIYDIGFTAGDMGLIEGIALIFSVLITIPFAKLINRNRIPLVALVAILVNAIGLIMLFTFIKDPSNVDNSSAFNLKNVPLFVAVFLVGAGYVLITQTCMVWVRGLFPKENRGQFEGIRSLFFTLLPMFIGTLAGNFIIKNTSHSEQLDLYGNPIDVPQENLFLFAGLMVLLTIVPLVFAWRAYDKRLKEQRSLADKIEIVELEK
ncbi:MAG: MFS transporter [Bacilli bacterium]|nr:MFS transporter [Bacillota bacterium]